MIDFVYLMVIQFRINIDFQRQELYFEKNKNNRVIGSNFRVKCLQNGFVNVDLVNYDWYFALSSSDCDCRQNASGCEFEISRNCNCSYR